MNDDIRWTYLTHQEIVEKLAEEKICISPPVVADLLKLHGFKKRKMSRCKTIKEVDINIDRLRNIYTQAGEPVVSVDSKKKEPFGSLYREGKVYSASSPVVYDHSFAPCKPACPYLTESLISTRIKSVLIWGCIAMPPSFSMTAWFCGGRPMEKSSTLHTGTSCSCLRKTGRRNADADTGFQLLIRIWRICLSFLTSSYRNGIIRPCQFFEIGKLLFFYSSGKKGRGQVIMECSIQTDQGVKVADAAWGSDAFIAEHGVTTPYSTAPEICVEIISPSNSKGEIEEKIQLYLAKGAHEVWIVNDDGEMRYYTAQGEIAESSEIPVD